VGASEGPFKKDRALSIQSRSIVLVVTPSLHSSLLFCLNPALIADTFVALVAISSVYLSTFCPTRIPPERPTTSCSPVFYQSEQYSERNLP
jgi:hypothetical protein